MDPRILEQVRGLPLGEGKIVLVFRGVSGAGKSTLAKLIAEVVLGTVIASADNFMVNEIGAYKYDASKLGAAHGACFRTFIKALLDDAPVVIVDNTNVGQIDIAPYVAGAAAYGYRSLIVEFQIDPKHALSRATHSVPEDKIAQMTDRLAALTLPPWWPVWRVIVPPPV